MRPGDVKASLRGVIMQKMTLIVGLGKTGQSIARYLRYKNLPFAVYDTREAPPGEALFRQTYPDIPLYLKTYPENLHDNVSKLICSPGVSLAIALIHEARVRHIPIESDIDCLAREVDAPMVAITGTNGKSTVTCLLGEIAQAAGMKTAVAGNIGTPVLDFFLDEPGIFDVWVLELSSFQLELTSALRPAAAVVLNISPDHLDRHHTPEAYRAAKHRIYQGAQACVFNRDDVETKPDLDGLESGVHIISFGSDEPVSQHAWGLRHDANHQLCLARGDVLILSVDDINMKGRHNWMNALATCALAELLAIPMDVCVAVLKTFSGLPHRCQRVRVLDDVVWINDSKGTNVGATESAITGLSSSVKGKLVLIAGGQGKGGDFQALRQPVSEHVRALVLIGEDAKLLDEALRDVVDIYHAVSLADAVKQAQSCAESGDAVLLSPACASLDMFDNFNHRGEVFTALVHAL